METYIELLTKGLKEYFIAIVDIEKNLADKFLKREAEYAMTWFDRKEYSQAVVLRNDRNVSKIVLFSNDSVKMIDSLKDFVEYPAIPEDKSIFWNCLTKALGQEPDIDCKRVLDSIMESRQIILEELFQYLNSCIGEAGNLEFEKMVDNLYQLDLWRCEKIEKAKSKQYLKKLIRNSDPLLVETKLIGGIVEKKVEFPVKKRQNIMKWLSKNDLKSVFYYVRYNEKIEELFKGSGRKPKEPSQERQEEHSYENSYEYALQEMPEEPMDQVEEMLFKPEIEKETVQEISLSHKVRSPRRSLEQEDEILYDSRQKFSYEDEQKIEEEFQEIRKLMELLSLTEEKKEFLREKLGELQQLFLEAKKEGSRFTPAYLWHYAQSQEKFVKCYFALMGRCVSDKGIARMCLGMHFLSRLQRIFCREENGRIFMPFYHPLAGFYLISLQRKYEKFRELLGIQTGEFWEQIVRALIHKEVMDFPVRYLLNGEELYQLDYGSIQNINQEIIFEKIQEHTANSWVDIRLLNEDLLDYMERQKYLSEVNVTIVDIHDICKIASMTRKLKGFAKSKKSMLHKVVFNIISNKEEELKKQLQENMEMDLEYPQVLFRFTKEMYVNGQEYDIERIIHDSDLLFLADSSILYQKPKLKEWRRQPNQLLLSFEELDIRKLFDEKQDNGNVLEILWDSMHFMELNHDVKLALWDTKELKQSLLNQIRQKVGGDSHRTVVILSSNPQLMQHMYHLPEFQVRHSILSGQEMLLVNFHAGSRRRLLEEKGEASVTVSLKPFLEGVSGLDDMKYILFDKDELSETPYLTISCQERVFNFKCMLFINNQEEEDRERKEHYRKLVKDIVLLLNKNNAFKKKFIMMLYEEVNNIQTALMLDYLQRIEIKENSLDYEEQIGKPQKGSPADIVAVMEFQKMLGFFRERNGIDEYAIHTFVESGLYHIEMLRQCISVDQHMSLLDKDTIEKMKILYTKWEKKNG
ncbi:MAG: hypothetical protein HFI78_08675 [Lachnospiraceae bacterium]|nr:hypothetical protein [Lachnospiraceae bacterium]